MADLRTEIAVEFLCRLLTSGCDVRQSFQTFLNIMKETDPEQAQAQSNIVQAHSSGVQAQSSIVQVNSNVVQAQASGVQAPKSLRQIIQHRDSSSESEDSIIIEREGRRIRWTTNPWNRFETMKLDELYYRKTIGVGAFGKVVLVEDWWTGQHYALKILAINDVLTKNQSENVRRERETLIALRGHPFIVNMYWHSRDFYNIYFLMEFATGGELFYFLKRAERFSQKISSFYAAEVLCALEYMHDRNIVHRDIKPENLLLDKDGHVKITDFGSATKLWFMSREVCGTPEYLCPEMIRDEPYSKAVDWWAFGVLIYEMQAGRSPFYDPDVFITWSKALEGNLKFPFWNFDRDARDLIRKLLTPEKSRLGRLWGASEVKRHRFFAKFDWFQVYSKSLPPPIIPIIFFKGDTHNFGAWSEPMDKKPVKKSRFFNF